MAHILNLYDLIVSTSVGIAIYPNNGDPWILAMDKITEKSDKDLAEITTYLHLQFNEKMV